MSIAIRVFGLPNVRNLVLCSADYSEGDIKHGIALRYETTHHPFVVELEGLERALEVVRLARAGHDYAKGTIDKVVMDDLSRPFHPAFQREPFELAIRKTRYAAQDREWHEIRGEMEARGDVPTCAEVSDEQDRRMKARGERRMSYAEVLAEMTLISSPAPSDALEPVGLADLDARTGRRITPANDPR